MKIKKWGLTQKQQNIIYWLCFVLLLGVICFLSFYKLDAKYVDRWDEARHGINAYEMFKSGSVVKSTYLYETDYYNLKPPLSMWSIMLSFTIFGTNVFALRFFSAACYVILALIVGIFVKRRYGTLESLFTLGFLSANTDPFIAHMVRAGDADSLYVLIFTVAMLAMLSIKENQKNLYVCGFCFALAFLTKSFHAGIIAVVGGLFLLLTGELKRMSVKTWVKFAASSLVPIFLWVVPRYFVDGTSFFRKMWETDVLNRTSEGFGSVEGTATYYLEYFLGFSGQNFPNLVNKGRIYAFALLICIVGVVFYNQIFTKARYQNIIGYLLWIFIPFTAFSLVRTKLVWYQYPVTIPLLMAAGIFSAKLIKDKKIIRGIRILLAIVIVFGISHFSKDAYEQVMNKINNQQSAIEFQQLIKEAAQSEKKQTKATDNSMSAYTIYEEGITEWYQQDVFVAEAYGDFTCKNTKSIDEVLKDINKESKILYFIHRSQVENLQEKLNEQKIAINEIAGSENFIVVEAFK